MTLRVDGSVEAGGFRVEIELMVEPGETVAVVGPNGAGKTTVLRAIAGLERMRSGRVEHVGATWDDAGSTFVPAAQRAVGMVFQRYLLFAHLTVVENVAFGLRSRGWSRAQAGEAAQAALERFAVGQLAGRRPRQLSGGEQQRVALARALVGDPSVVLLDEPFAALDASARAGLRRDLRTGLADVVASRVLVAHDVADVHTLADRVVVLEAGRVTQRGALAELTAAPRSPFVADLLGTNLLRGMLRDGGFRSEDGFELTVGAHDAPDGTVLAAIRPTAIALHRERPEGSPRNVWSSEIDDVDETPDRVRVRLRTPATLVVEVTPAGWAALAAGAGNELWVSVKASEITVTPD